MLCKICQRVRLHRHILAVPQYSHDFVPTRQHSECLQEGDRSHRCTTCVAFCAFAVRAVPTYLPRIYSKLDANEKCEKSEKQLNMKAKQQGANTVSNANIVNNSSLCFLACYMFSQVLGVVRAWCITSYMYHRSNEAYATSIGHIFWHAKLILDHVGLHVGISRRNSHVVFDSDKDNSRYSSMFSRRQERNSVNLFTTPCDTW